MSAERRCVICGESLADRRRDARTCSNRCRLRLARGTLPPQPRSCEHCSKTFTPKRSDGRHCPDCRRSEPWRRNRPPPWVRCPYVDARGYTVWARESRRNPLARLNGQRRTFENWEKHGGLARLDVVDRMCIALDLALPEIPDELWIEGAV